MERPILLRFRCEVAAPALSLALAMSLVLATCTSCTRSTSDVVPTNPATLGESEGAAPSESESDSSTTIADNQSAADDDASKTRLRPAPQVTDEPRQLAEDRASSDSKLAKGEINFDDLKFEIDKGQAFEKSQLNDRVKSLDGKKVKLSGFILPSSVFRNSGIDRFVLVRDNQECCFGPGAALFDCVWVQMVDGNTADFEVRPVTVEGTFKIDTETYRYPDGVGPDGSSHLAVFEIEGVNVK